MNRIDGIASVIRRREWFKLDAVVVDQHVALMAEHDLDTDAAIPIVANDASAHEAGSVGHARRVTAGRKTQRNLDRAATHRILDMEQDLVCR